MAQRIVYLVRHGQYVLDREHARAGQLTTLGRRQARRVASRLMEYPIDRIHHSDMPRAIETAELVGARLPGAARHQTRILREGNPGVAGKRRRARELATRERMDGVVERYFRPCRGRDRHELLVCHGNLIRYLLLRALAVPAGGWMRIDTVHCGLSIVRVLPSHTRVRAINDIGHLPPRMRTAQ
ncbi:MAG: histidine phosphatase family protein [Myxococcota bacterium]